MILVGNIPVEKSAVWWSRTNPAGRRARSWMAASRRCRRCSYLGQGLRCNAGMAATISFGRLAMANRKCTRWRVSFSTLNRAESAKRYETPWPIYDGPLATARIMPGAACSSIPRRTLCAHVDGRAYRCHAGGLPLSP